MIVYLTDTQMDPRARARGRREIEKREKKQSRKEITWQVEREKAFQLSTVLRL